MKNKIQEEERIYFKHGGYILRKLLNPLLRSFSIKGGIRKSQRKNRVFYPVCKTKINAFCRDCSLWPNSNFPNPNGWHGCVLLLDIFLKGAEWGFKYNRYTGGTTIFDPNLCKKQFAQIRQALKDAAKKA